MTGTIFGGNTGETAETLRRKREIAQAMVARGSMSAPRNVGEGIAAIGQALFGGLNLRAANKIEAERRSEDQGAYKRFIADQLLGAAGVQPPPPTMPQPVASEPKQMPPFNAGEGNWFDRIQAAESGGDPDAVSPKGARGLMQIMPDTARSPGFGVPTIFDMAAAQGIAVPDQSEETLNALLANPELNRRFGEAYATAMLDRFGGDERLASAAYNAGPGAVDQYGGIPPFPETQAYVERVNGGSIPGETVALTSSEASGPAAAPPAQNMPAAMAPGANVAALLDLAGREYLSEGERAVVNALLGQALRGPEPEPDAIRTLRALQSDPALMAAEIARRNAGRPMTSVSVGGDNRPQVGTIPQGYQLQPTPEGGWQMAPIPGGPAAAEADAAANKAELRAGQTATSGQIVLEDIGRLRKRVENAPWYNPVTGPVAPLMGFVPGSNRVDAQALSDTIGANIGFDKLNQMREASPTGGALGSVTERELALLQSVLGNISLSQSEDQLLSNLDRLETLYSGIMRKAAAYPNAAEFGFGGMVDENGDDAPPAGVDPGVWGVMTPEERALFR